MQAMSCYSVGRAGGRSLYQIQKIIERRKNHCIEYKWHRCHSWQSKVILDGDGWVFLWNLFITYSWSHLHCSIVLILLGITTNLPKKSCEGQSDAWRWRGEMVMVKRQEGRRAKVVVVSMSATESSIHRASRRSRARDQIDRLTLRYR